MTATELAHALDLDPGTVVRFAQKIGYPGYPDLQRDLRKRLKNELLHLPSSNAERGSNTSDAAFAAAARCLELSRRSFSINTSEELINALDVSERIFLFADELAFPIAVNLASWLSSTGYTIQVTGENPAEAARKLAGAHPKDMIITIEVSADNAFLLHTLQAAKEAGLKTAAVVASPSSRLTDLADLILTGHAIPDIALRQWMVETIVHVFLQMLRQARPLRFKNSSEAASRLRKQLRQAEI